MFANEPVDLAEQDGKDLRRLGSLAGSALLEREQAGPQAGLAELFAGRVLSLGKPVGEDHQHIAWFKPSQDATSIRKRTEEDLKTAN